MSTNEIKRVNVDPLVQSDPILAPLLDAYHENPSPSQWKRFFLHPAHHVYDYVFYGESSFWDARPLTSMRILRRLLEWGDKPFYASDLLPGFSSPGAEMHKMHNGCLIRATGNTKIVDVEVGNNLYKKFPAKEWELCISTDELCRVYVRIKNFIIDEL